MEPSKSAAPNSVSRTSVAPERAIVWTISRRVKGVTCWVDRSSLFNPAGEKPEGRFLPRLMLPRYAAFDRG